jgi:N4-gp56 family major capsid protein
MVDGTTTYGIISQRTAAWAATVMLRHAEPVLVLQKFGTPKEMPRNKANVVKFRRPIPFSAATTPLTEGVTPTAQRMQYEDVTATLKQYGRPIEITDVVADLAEDPVLKDAAMLAGEQAALTLEMVTHGIIKAGTTVAYTNGAARASVNTPITVNKQRGITRALKAQKARKITSVLAPSANYATQAVEASFVALAHTDMESDVRNLPGFIPTAQYGSRATLCPEEIGAVEDCRYVLSPELAAWADGGGAFGGSGTNMVSTSGTSADVYPILYVSKESYGLIPLKGKRAITPMVINPDTPSGSDPLGQRGYVSWKTYYTCVILNENWLSRLESAATDL